MIVEIHIYQELKDSFHICGHLLMRLIQPLMLKLGSKSILIMEAVGRIYMLMGNTMLLFAKALHWDLE